MADSFTDLLVDLFTMLPAVDSQELFGTLHKVHPTPVDAKRSLEMVHYGHNDWRQCLLDGATAFSRTQKDTTFFPSKPPMEGFERQLEETSDSLLDRYVARYHRSNANSTLQSGSERAEILQVCRTLCAVSTSHISFLRQLHKRLQEAHAPLQFHLQLLTTQVSNCLHYDWARRGSSYYEYGHRYGGHNLQESLLFSDIGTSLQALKDMWQFSMSPVNVLHLLESVQDQASPQFSDVMCDILISVLDCQASLHLRIFELIHKASLKPQHILQAVNIVSCSMSGKAQSSDECRTTFIQCAEALGKAYSQYKDSGIAADMLVKLRVKAANLLHQARSNPVTKSVHQLELMYQPSSIGVDVLSVMHVVCDSGQDALADLLALVVMLPGRCLLPSLEKMTELCNYYFKDDGPSNPLQVPPFKEKVMALLEKRKEEIKILARSHGETWRGREFINDLKACFQFLGDEAAITTFEQELATISQNADRQAFRRVRRLMPQAMVYGRDDDEEEDVQAFRRMVELAHAERDMLSFFW